MKQYEEWLFKANHDIEAAKLLFESSDKLIDVAIYHTQQASEKALKGFLLKNGKPLEKTHNVRYLLTLAIEIDSSLECLSEAAFAVSPFYTLFRYPSSELMPDLKTTQTAIKSADLIISTIEKLFNRS